jgi:hypothetical protein
VDRAEPGAVPHLREPAAGEVMNPQKKRNALAANKKTALVLCVIAAFFFAAVILKRLWM